MARSIIIILLFIFLPSVISAAPAKKAKPTAAEIFMQAQNAYYNYDFEEATDLLEEYRTMQTKAKKPLDESFNDWVDMVNLATNAFGRVQKIVVIDSINMPRADFFKAFKLSDSAGTVRRVKDFNLPVESENEEVGFLSEGGVRLLSAQPDEGGELRIIESLRLLDGNWENREALEGDFEKSGDYVFPFLGGDGVTLYFANDGEDSMGGYDLFVAQRDPISGESLQPLNLGMPFNSPYDDLMIAIDEEKGLGWWATDRNHPGEDITVYVYILDDVRKNYPSDMENLVEFAKLSDYKATWEEGKEDEYSKILEFE